MKEKQGRSDEQRRVGARRWLFVDQGPFFFFFLWPSWLSRPLVRGWDPGKALGSLSCVFLSLLAQQSRLEGWALGTTPRRDQGGNGAARREEQMARSGLGQTMIAVAGGVRAALQPPVISL